MSQTELSRESQALLARFPGPVKLQISRTKTFGRAAAALFFTIGGLLVCVSAVAPAVAWLVPIHPIDGGGTAILAGVGLFFAIVGAIGVWAQVARLTGDRGALALSRDGFAYRLTARAKRVPWRSASDFTVLTQAGRSGVVMFDEAKPRENLLNRLNRAVTGHNTVLPDVYGLSAADLAELMTRWRERALNDRNVSPANARRSAFGAR